MEEMKSECSDLDLRKFFEELELSAFTSNNYINSLSQIQINNVPDLKSKASVFNMSEIGFLSNDIDRIMQKLFTTPSGAQTKWEGLPHSFTKKDSNAEEYFHRPIESISSQKLTRDALIIIKEIGHGASGRVFKALFCPTLTFLAVKRIEMENAIARKVVGQELKFMYEVARSKFIGPPVVDRAKKGSSDVDDLYTLMSGQLYSDVIAGNHELRAETEDAARAAPWLKNNQAANNPYIISFYDAYIDTEHGSISLILEYMDGGSIQSMLTDGRMFTEDDAAVVAFSVLSALIDLHGKNILHRDIKPSNILADTHGRIKLADFGINKEIFDSARGAESFTGTLAYMSPARIKADVSYSFEADMWSLGITLITIIAGKLPFPTNLGSWQLMNAILCEKQPTLPLKSTSAELLDFIHQCLNQPLHDNMGSWKLLNHPFLSSARDRGVLPSNRRAVLSEHGRPVLMDVADEKVIEKIVEMAISWQLEQCEDDRAGAEFINDIDKQITITLSMAPIKYTISEFAPDKINWLAFQMGIKASFLQQRFNAKYDQIRTLSSQGWCVEGLRKVVWPRDMDVKK